MNKPSVICTKCKWVSFAVTRAYAEDEVKRFNAYYNLLTRKEQVSYYGGKGSSVKGYEGCMLCGGQDFRLATEKEVPYGSTLSPVIWEGEENPHTGSSFDEFTVDEKLEEG